MSCSTLLKKFKADIIVITKDNEIATTTIPFTPVPAHTISIGAKAVLGRAFKTALAPIMIIWAGTGVSGIVVVALSILLIITIISTYNYFKNVEEDKIKMLKSFNASKLQILFKLIIPCNFINIISVIKINVGMSWIGVIVGEFLVSRAGIGYLIMYGGQVFDLDLVMMGVFVLAILAFVMWKVIDIIEIKLVKKLRSK